eukprot:TRINITY_DN2671_c0_g3_i1.p1 TRINITY_DN2671_c0_g3~~TRINITY_DN2671_c0_g3_i1.p1  ORF type:complete len:706 (+),score=119.60 TRINITY_DN2671_c0_g3_i1:218-2119(+)
MGAPTMSSSDYVRSVLFKSSSQVKSGVASAVTQVEKALHLPKDAKAETGPNGSATTEGMEAIDAGKGDKERGPLSDGGRGVDKGVWGAVFQQLLTQMGRQGNGNVASQLGGPDDSQPSSSGQENKGNSSNGSSSTPSKTDAKDRGSNGSTSPPLSISSILSAFPSPFSSNTTPSASSFSPSKAFDSSASCENSSPSSIESLTNGAPKSPADAAATRLTDSLFQQTEALLGSWALLGFNNSATKRESSSREENQLVDGAKSLIEAGSSAFMEKKGESGSNGEDSLVREIDSPGEESDEDEATKQARITALFKSAETAVEAWAVLASTLGQDSFVASSFEKVCFVENKESDTQVALWVDAKRKRLTVAFRGTEQTKLKDLVTDLNVAPVSFGPERARGGNFSQEAMVHGGFLKAYDSVRVRVLALVKAIVSPSKGMFCEDKSDKWEIWVTGHSLGGALATLLSEEVLTSRMARECRYHVRMYNFGSPRVGNRRFVDRYNKVLKDSWRVVNKQDIIPTVPKLMGFCHVDTPVYLNFGRGRGMGIVVGDEAAEDIRDVVEKTPDVLFAQFMQGERRILERLLQTEMALLSTIRDGSAVMMHMEDFYFMALLQHVEDSIGGGLPEAATSLLANKPSPS